MTLLTAESISKRFNEQIIFEAVSFSIESSKRIGLVGRNGCGKTTLFEMLTGHMDTDTGTVQRAKSCRIDYIRQEKSDFTDLTVNEFVALARPDLTEARKQIHDLSEQLENDPHDAKAIERLGELQHKYEVEGGFHFDDEARLILIGLGFVPERHNDRMKNFSGGEKNRAALAQLLAGNGNLLLLDEPTNHLDIESTIWLEEYLSRVDRAFIVVSHDRAFLTAVAQSVWEIHNGQIEFYSGGFEKYLSERSERRRLHAHHYRHQQEEIKRIEEYVRRNMAGQKTKQAQSKLKHLARIKRIAPPPTDGRAASIGLTSSGRSHAHVVSADDVTLAYGAVPVVEAIHFNLYRGEKIGMVGRNGSGKSTILSALIGELVPVKGDLSLGNNVNVAYFDQELSDLNPRQTVLDSMWELDPGADSNKIRSYLGRFGFSGEDPTKLVMSLSGGEKTKLSLARLLYHPANFIIFDEPTNHLDIDSREALEDALLEYDGSYLIVSHDRHFLDRVVGKIFHIADGRLKEYHGNYSYFKEKTARVEPTTKVRVPKQKSAYHEFKEKGKQRKRLKRDIEAAKTKIKQLEEEINRLGVDLNENIPTSDWEKLQKTADRKHAAEDEVLNLYETLEKLQEQQRADQEDDDNND